MHRHREGKQPKSHRIQSGERAGSMDKRHGVFMISIAARLADMHPQTLRIYEQRGLITPDRSPKNTRLYSHEDVERLKRIQQLTTEMGMNLAGVERVFDLEEKLRGARRRLELMEQELKGMRERMIEEVEAVRRSFRRELVPYRHRSLSVVRARDARPAKAFRIPIEHRKASGGVKRGKDSQGA